MWGGSFWRHALGEEDLWAFGYSVAFGYSKVATREEDFGIRGKGILGGRRPIALDVS